ncbi:LysR family transcriptional regulator [Simiduia aestuariiviva]|uniref:HTH-type transcriptional regulator MetR n=1 Tax=Simiduia aestuariiviva TaxID=1510459 RepID=A0A839UP54_9GAMM|nr:LysR family transcriptional regulator [Simiduia aestuariiviva]MBB3169984.1 LysR family transcriptional regulator for metE and metH [Simiduia aestuariiviva]
MNLEIRQLKTLVALRETGTLVEAAQRLCLTQSALSHQMKELEHQLGQPVFVRKSRPIRFTEPGQRLLKLADTVLGALADAQRDLQKLVHGEAGRLFMAIECHSCFNWLMPVIDQYRPHWPQVELDFSGGFTFEPLPALARGEVDVVITTDPQPLKGLVYEPLFDCEMRLAVAPGHPLANGDRVQPKQLQAQTLITYPVAPERLDIMHRFLQPAGIQPEIRTTELTLMMVQMVASGRGVCCLPNWVLDEYAAQGQLKSLALGDGIWSRVQLAMRAETRETAYAQDFIRMARAHCFAQLKGIRPAPVE